MNMISKDQVARLEDSKEQMLNCIKILVMSEDGQAEDHDWRLRVLSEDHMEIWQISRVLDGKLWIACRILLTFVDEDSSSSLKILWDELTGEIVLEKCKSNEMIEKKRIFTEPLSSRLNPVLNLLDREIVEKVMEELVEREWMN